MDSVLLILNANNINPTCQSQNPVVYEGFYVSKFLGELGIVMNQAKMAISTSRGSPSRLCLLQSIAVDSSLESFRDANYAVAVS